MKVITPQTIRALSHIRTVVKDGAEPIRRVDLCKNLVEAKIALTMREASSKLAGYQSRGYVSSTRLDMSNWEINITDYGREVSDLLPEERGFRKVIRSPLECGFTAEEATLIHEVLLRFAEERSLSRDITTPENRKLAREIAKVLRTADKYGEA